MMKMTEMTEMTEMKQMFATRALCAMEIMDTCNPVGLSMPHLIHALILFIFLLPCAIQDWRTRRVSNWLTIPGFALAWIAALWFQNLPLTVAVFAGCYVAWQMKWMGAADGKLATLMAAVAPVALMTSGLLLALSFLALRLSGRPDEHLPAAAWFFAGSMLHFLYLLAAPLFTT